jgi:hypothetical protein
VRGDVPFSYGDFIVAIKIIWLKVSIIDRMRKDHMMEDWLLGVKWTR